MIYDGLERKKKAGIMQRLSPYGPVSLDPATMVLHYAQETFEGLKAYRTKEGKLLLFRPEMNAKRFANSNRRLCMEVLPGRTVCGCDCYFSLL